MDDPTTTATLGDEDILTYTASDEALEAAAGGARGAAQTVASSCYQSTWCQPG